MAGAPQASGTSRLTTPLTWAVLLFCLWLWGKDLTEGVLPQVLGGGVTAPQFADGSTLPPPAAPLPADSAPQVLEIASLGVRADIIERGVDATGGVDPPPFSSPQVAGWYRDGPTPGAEGAALLVGHVDTETDRAVFYALSGVETGSEVRVTRADGSTAEFTVSEVEVVEHEDFDPDQVYGQRTAGQAELRLITCGGTFDRERGSYSANVVVSAYLTGSDPSR